MEHNNPVILATLQQLRQQKIAIAIDDFGTGYSSLGYLQTLPVNTLKVDRSFVATIGTGSVNAPVLEAIIQLSQSLDIDIIAEGVETHQQAEWFCDTVFGVIRAGYMPVRNVSKRCCGSNGRR